LSESDLVKMIVDYLLLQGHFAIRVNSGMQFFEGKNGKKHAFRGAPAGTADIIGLLNPSGRFLAIEAKVGRNQPTQLQQAFLEEVNRKGGLGFTAWSLDDVIRVLGD